MKKPNIFKPTINHKICNNKRAYYSFLENDQKQKDTRYEKEEPKVTINRLLNSGSYIFSKKVEIITNNKTYTTKIAGKMGDKIVTLDKDVIAIDDIKQIKEI